MNHDIAMKWVADLRQPNLKQTKGKLKRDDAYCCLGRLCVVMGCEFDEHDNIKGLPGYYVLPLFIAKQAEMWNTNGEPRAPNPYIDGNSYDHLAHANDSGVPFTKIADWIESNWKDL